MTCILVDSPLHAANVGSILRQAAVLGQADSISAVLLAASEASTKPAAW